MSTTEYRLQCPVCAWRQDCKKKHTIESQGSRIRCPDFSLDLTLAKDRPSQDKKTEQ